jgi:excisionase family DNA binding protein
MQQQILITLSPDELQALIIESVNLALKVGPYGANPVNKPAEIIDRVELCKRLNISQPTARLWEKKGKIPTFRIGSNVRYNYTAVLEALQKNK